MKPELSIILPCFNEEENVKTIKKELIKELDELNLSYEIILVDDGSRDKTAYEAKKLMKAVPSIKLVKHDKNYGLGRAVRTGIAHANGKLLVTLDSDFTFHPRQIKNLLKRFKEGDVDCVIGSPWLGQRKNIPLIRKILSKGANVIYAILMGQSFTAMSPIFRLYQTNQLKELNLESEGFTINAEILFKLLQKKRKVVEIPAVLTARKYGVSKINNIKEIKNHIKLIFKIILWKFGFGANNKK